MCRMSLPAGYRIVVVPQARQGEFIGADDLTWAQGMEPEVLEQAPPALDWGERTVAVETAGAIVAVHASYAFALPVPGGTVPCSGQRPSINSSSV